MKKSLSKQLFFIYTLVLLLTTLTFYSVLSNWLIATYTDINYSKLDDFALTIESLMELDYDLEDYNSQNGIEFVIWDYNGKFYTSDRVFEIIDEDYVSELYNKITYNLKDDDYYRNDLDSIDKYFYSVVKTNDGNHYILTVSEGLLLSDMQQQTGIQIMILFSLTLLAGGLIIGFWSNILVSRISKIADHVKRMPKDDYATPYSDTNLDEIGLLSNSIDEMREQIHQNEETKKEIIQNLSHDIKTPLAVIKSYSEAILDGVETPDASIVIIKQSDVLQHKVESLLQLNRLNYLEQNREFEPINLSNIINRVVHNTKYLTNISFELDLDNSIFYGYEENYQTIIENIISNAIRFAETKIVIKLNNSKLSIYNDGPNIEDKFLDAAFKAYEKGSKGIFGVGMSIVKKTVDFFKLELIVQNEEVGVTFIIVDPNTKE